MQALYQLLPCRRQRGSVTHAQAGHHSRTCAVEVQKQQQRSSSQQLGQAAALKPAAATLQYPGMQPSDPLCAALFQFQASVAFNV